MQELRRSVVLFAITVVTACADQPSTSRGGQAIKLVERAPSAELIVMLGRDVEAGVATDVGGVSLTPIRPQLTGAWLMHVDDADVALAAGDSALVAQETSDALAAVSSDADVTWAYPNLPADFQFIPGDPYWSSQAWHYNAIRLPQAWDITVGSSSIPIAVIDTGSLPHPELVDRWAAGRDFVDNDSDPTDAGLGGVWWHHGIHVAGILGATTNEFPPRGTAGICWNCPLVPARILDAASVENAIEWASTTSSNPALGGNARVINMSLVFRNQGQTQTCNDVPGLRQAIADANARGVVVVESAGNYALSHVEAPSDCPGVISVAATQPSGALAAYSNHGVGVDLAAPGGGGNGNGNGGSGTSQYGPGINCPADGGPYDGATGAVSTWAVSLPTNQLVAADYCWRNLSGTSMSAPHVAGVVGLMLSVRPTLTPAQVLQILTATATLDPARITCAPNDCGAGLLDAQLAVRYAQNGGVPVVSMAPVNLGNVVVGTTGTATGTLNDSGSGPLTLGPQPVMQISGGGGQIEFAYTDGGGCASGTSCTRAFPALAAGGSMAVPLRCRPTAVGAITASLLINSNVIAGSTTVALSCTGQPPPVPDIAVSPTALGFGAVDLGTASPEQVVQVSNTGPAGTVLTLSATRSSSEFAMTCTGACTCTAATCTASLGGGAAIQLHVVFTPSALGARTGNISISSNDPDENPTVVSLTGTGVVPIPPPHLVVTATPSLAIGDVPLGDAAVVQVTVANSTGGDGSLLHFSVSQGSSQYRLDCTQGCTCQDEICTGTVGASTAGLVLTYLPTIVGPASSNLTFISDDPAAPVTTLTAEGNGVTDQVSVLDPPGGALYLFAPIGEESVAGTITVQNVGTQPLHIAQAAPTGLYAYALTVSAGEVGPQVVPPGGIASWEIICTPTWFGTQRATFRIDHDAPVPGSFTGIDIECNGDFDPVIEPPGFQPPVFDPPVFQPPEL